MRTAIYARYSSDDQRPESIRDQVRNCTAYASRQGWGEPVVYSDGAMSGSLKDRPDYQRMLSDARAHEWDVLLVDDLSRLSRDQVETAQAVRVLRYFGVRLIGVSDGVDTERKGHKLEVGLRGLMSEMYLDDLADKTHRGLMGQALAGFSAGGLPYGYQSESTRDGFKRVVCPERAEVITRVFGMFADGHSCRAIADTLNREAVESPRGNTWAHSAIYGDMKRGLGILNNPLYIGQQIWNRSHWVRDPVKGVRKRRERPESEWIITDHPELRIVDQALWDRVKARQQEIRGRTARQREALGKVSGGRAPKYLLSGLLFCATCGGRYVIMDRYRYGCAKNRNRGDAACDNRIRVPRKALEERLLATVKEDLLSEEAYQLFASEVRQLLRESRPDPSGPRKRLQEARREAENIMAAIRQGIITPSTKQALQDAEERQRRAQEELDAMDRYEPTQILPRAREVYTRMVGRLEQIEDVAGARDALKELLGDVRLVSEGEAVYAEMKTGGLSTACQITVVAGAGFERCFVPVKVRII